MANHSYEFDDVNHALQALSTYIQNGDEVSSRSGGTLEMRHVALRIANPLRREILLASRKANIAAQIAETAWVLAGRNDIGWLSHYLPRAVQFSDDEQTWRAGYGPRIRSWWDRPAGSRVANDKPVDQLAEVIAILNKDPNSRRAVISLFDPTVDLAPGKDIACNNWLAFTLRDGYLDLHVAARSNDLIWGWSGINQFEWSVLQEIVAEAVGAHVGATHYTMASLHVYEHHYHKLVKLEEDTLREEPFSPRFKRQSNLDPVEELDDMLEAFFRIEALIRKDPYASAVVGKVNQFPEPMFQSWLLVLAWWWSGDEAWLERLKGTALYEACKVSIQPQRSRREQHQPYAGTDFMQSVVKLHNEKHEAYGDSWKKRGELFSILPNIARKVDRLGAGETSDETSADTAIDLMVYLAKYQTWLEDQVSIVNKTESDRPKGANIVMLALDKRMIPEEKWETNAARDGHIAEDTRQRIGMIRDRFERLLKSAENDRKAFGHRGRQVAEMLPQAYILAKRLWTMEQDNDLDVFN